MAVGVYWVKFLISSSIHGTPEQLRGLGNLTRASFDTGVSCKWVKFKIWGELSP